MQIKIIIIKIYAHNKYIAFPNLWVYKSNFIERKNYLRRIKEMY